MNLAQAKKCALALPEATESPHFELTSFRVQGKIFATAPASGAYLHVFVDEDVRAPHIAADPDTYAPLPWGAKVVGLKITLSSASPATVKELLDQSWQRKAPKRLLNPAPTKGTLA
jgi:hypothetical protein